jgi:hypothetical protein
MKNIIPFLLVYASCLITTPSMASTLNTPAEINRTSYGEANLRLAQFRHHNRQYHVYYRNSRDSRWTRNWTFGGIYANRQDAERAARRWENRGYRTSIRVRGGEANHRGDWDRGDWNRDR